MTTAPVPPSSRYAGIEVAVRVEPDGREVAYVRRRFCPHPEDLALVSEHVVTGADRIDRVAAAYLGDPEQFWRVADANRAVRADVLTDVAGRRLRITQPEGFPGPAGAGGASVIDGVHLHLMIGPVVPIPAPQQVMDALTSCEVTTTDTGPTMFQLTFTLADRSPLHTLFLLAGGGPILFLRVVIWVTVNGTPTVLADGVITDHQVAPGADEGHASLVVTGEDITVLMDQQDFSGMPFPAMPAEGRVALLCAKYALFGLVPLIIPSVLIDTPIPTSATPSQQGTDLAYIKALADRVGYVFYVDPGPVPGANIAYWGPRIKVGVPQPALNVDMDAYRNVSSLTFRFDSQKTKIPTVFIYNELTKVVIPIPIPPITPLSPPLGLIPPIPTSIGDLQPVADNLAKRPIPQAIMIGLAKAADYAEAVTGEGSLDVVRYGRVLRARQLVGVRGVGPAFDGLHYVTKVTHTLKRGSYTQKFSLSRNGLVSTVPAVVP